MSAADQTERTREVVQRYLDIVVDARPSHEDSMRALSEILADDVAHTIVGDLMFVGGEYHGKAETIDFLKRAGAWFQGRGRITVRRVIVEGEWAAIEWERTAKYWNGRDYRREYAVVVQVRGGKLQTVREYVP